MILRLTVRSFLYHLDTDFHTCKSLKTLLYFAASSSQLTDIAINEQIDHDDGMSEEKLKSLMDDMTNKMVEFTHKTKHRGHFLDRIHETGDSETAVNVRSKSLEENDSRPSTPTYSDPLVQETQKSNENNECC